jgi:RNA polymerase sigma factor (sigma-70 family)
MEAADDVTLVRACRDGDALAWETLVRRYQRLIYTIPRRAGLDEDLAAEVFQQVCVALLSHIQRIEQPERIGAWLVTAARRESWRQSRRAGATEQLAVGDDDEEPTLQLVDGSPLPDEQFERLERQHAVRLALTTLDERCRTLLTALFYQPAPPSYSELASAMKISEGSIGPTRARCLQKLRQALDNSER